MEEKMKKALLAAALMTAGVVAHAQSSVTLYGRLDAGIEYMTGVPQGVGRKWLRQRAARTVGALKAATGVPACGA
jgi:Outer membrane protein (porin)